MKYDCKKINKMQTKHFKFPNKFKINCTKKKNYFERFLKRRNCEFTGAVNIARHSLLPFINLTKVRNVLKYNVER